MTETEMAYEDPIHLFLKKFDFEQPQLLYSI